MEADVAHAEITGRKPRVTADRAKRRPGPPQTKHSKTADDKARTESKAQQGDDAKKGAAASRDAEYEPRPHGAPKSDTPKQLPPIRGPPLQAAAYSIREFCAAHRLSQSMYFKMRSMGFGPREMHVGTRILITMEAAAAWRAEREAETAATNNTNTNTITTAGAI
jgi:hypothetical protein